MLPIIILILSGLSLCLILLLIPRLFAPKSSEEPSHRADYECGIESPVRKSSKAPVRFFLTAILFILFDIEIVFLYPFALAYRDFLQSEGGVAILLAMGLFLLLFIFGLWWEIKTKALDWK